MSKFENDLSTGSVPVKLIKFAMPFLLSNLIQTLYNVVDMIVVGHFAGTESMSGVTIGSQMTFIITNMVFGLCVGATVLVGQYRGSGDRKAIKETIGTLFTTLLVLSVVITIVMLFLNKPLLRLINTPQKSFDEAHSYFFYTMLGTVFIFGYNAFSAVMRGLGDSKNPLIFVTIAAVVNVALDLLFVVVFGMKASGAAIATVIAQGISMFLCILYWKKNSFIFEFKLSSFGFNPIRLKTLLKVGIPTSIQNVATGVSFLFLTSLVNEYDYIASAAVGAVGKLNGFAILPAAAMSAAVSAMCAQNIGAGEIKRAAKTMYYGVAIAFTISAVIFLVITLFPQVCLRIFSDDKQMIAQGVEYISTFKYDYLIVPFIFCLNGLFIGSGHTAISLFNSVISSLLVRIPAAYIFGNVLEYGLSGVGLGGPVASVAALVVAVIFFMTGKWKRTTVLKRTAEIPDVDI